MQSLNFIHSLFVFSPFSYAGVELSPMTAEKILINFKNRDTVHYMHLLYHFEYDHHHHLKTRNNQSGKFLTCWAVKMTTQHYCGGKPRTRVLFSFALALDR